MVYHIEYAVFCSPEIEGENMYQFFTLLTALIHDLRIVVGNSGMALTIS